MVTYKQLQLIACLNTQTTTCAIKNNVEKGGVSVLKVIFIMIFTVTNKQHHNTFGVLFISKANSCSKLLLEVQLLAELLELIPAVNISNANLWFIW